MDNFFVPNETDFRRWIREALAECLKDPSSHSTLFGRHSEEEPLMTRKEIAGIFRISLVTLYDWMKHGLPSHKQRGRVYFLRSEVMAHVRQNKNRLSPGQDFNN